MKLTLSDERHVGSLTSRVKKIRVKCHSDNNHSQDCQFEGMTFRILCMSDISISGFHYFEVSTFGWIDVKPCSVRNGSSVSTAVNKRGEGTVVAVQAYLCRCTSFPFYDGLLWLHFLDARKGDGFFFFQTTTGAQGSFFFYFYNTFPYFFSTFTTRPSIPSLFQRPTGHESRCFSCQCRIKDNSKENSVGWAGYKAFDIVRRKDLGGD